MLMDQFEEKGSHHFKSGAVKHITAVYRKETVNQAMNTLDM
jgi:hypothetical protein